MSSRSNFHPLPFTKPSTKPASLAELAWYVRLSGRGGERDQRRSLVS